MGRRTEDIVEDIRQQQSNHLRSSPHYDIALDGNTDSVDTVQLVVFVQYILADWCVHQELLGLVPLSGRTGTAALDFLTHYVFYSMTEKPHRRTAGHHY